MKKTIYLLISLLFIFTLLIPTTSFAFTDIEQLEWEDISLSDEEFESILAENPNNSLSPLSTELISIHAISVSKKIML